MLFSLRRQLRFVWRRLGWFFGQPGVLRKTNILLAVAECVLRRKRMAAYPLMVKIDISPLCNLKCTVCVHAHPHGNPDLEKQQFCADQKISIDQYQKIIDEISGRTSAVSLYYLGDPLMHPDVDQMCRIATDARLNVHLNTNFSFNLSDERIESIVTSGVTHLTVCVDGFSQECYQRTRVGGRIDVVKSNLERACRARRRLGQKHLKIEVQFIKFKHNEHEVESVREWCNEIGVDQFTAFWGSLSNYTHTDPEKCRVDGPREKELLPRCWLPYFGTLIKYNGDVIPCCNYRLGAQYAVGGDCRVLGNVFEKGLKAVWNSVEYQTLRKLVYDPAVSDVDPSYKCTFCYGCNTIFHTNKKDVLHRAPKYTFEELYFIDENGRSVPRRDAA